MFISDYWFLRSCTDLACGRSGGGFHCGALLEFSCWVFGVSSLY